MTDWRERIIVGRYKIMVHFLTAWWAVASTLATLLVLPMYCHANTTSVGHVSPPTHDAKRDIWPARPCIRESCLRNGTAAQLASSIHRIVAENSVQEPWNKFRRQTDVHHASSRTTFQDRGEGNDVLSRGWACTKRLYFTGHRHTLPVVHQDHNVRKHHEVRSWAAPTDTTRYGTSDRDSCAGGFFCQLTWDRKARRERERTRSKRERNTKQSPRLVRPCHKGSVSNHGTIREWNYFMWGRCFLDPVHPAVYISLHLSEVKSTLLATGYLLGDRVPRWAWRTKLLIRWRKYQKG